MKNKLTPRVYRCKCGEEIKEYVWDNDVAKATFKCNCGTTLGFNDIKIEKVGSVTAIRTPTKNR
jgi:hypothetical protein